MERDLMDFCPHYEKDVCDETVKSARRMSGPQGPGDPAVMFPVGEEQKKLDEICESCPHGLFGVEKPEDPLCRVCRRGLWDIEKSIIKEGTVNDETGSIPIYHFKCPQCNKEVFSKTNLWA